MSGSRLLYRCGPGYSILDISFMNRRLPVLIGAIFLSCCTFAQQPSERRSVALRILKQPSLESITNRSAIITWTTNAGGSSIAHYGFHPNSLEYVAESRNRWNRNLPYMVHRVFLQDLKAGTTYYYVVESSGIRSLTYHFTTFAY